LEQILTCLFIGASLSMDAFAVTVGEGLSCPRGGMKNTLRYAVYFGFFQALMPLAGFCLAGTVSGKLMSAGPYISFFLLSFVGAKMLVDAIKGGAEKGKEAAAGGSFSHPRALVLALATSIDALAVGASLAFTETRILPTCLIIGGTTFLICILGGRLCSRLPKGSGKGAGLAGGLVLIGIGIKLLVEGTVLS
jgi:putative Mn2+ efflux pump MntP